jgi:hypothetical protein
MRTHHRGAPAVSMSPAPPRPRMSAGRWARTYDLGAESASLLALLDGYDDDDFADALGERGDDELMAAIGDCDDTELCAVLLVVRAYNNIARKAPGGPKTAEQIREHLARFLSPGNAANLLQEISRSKGWLTGGSLHA